MANVQIKRYSGSAWVDINPKTTIGQVRNLSSQLANMQSDIDDKAQKTHGHTISEITSLQSTLDSKLTSISDLRESYLIWGGKNLSGQVTPIGMSLSNEHSANRLAFINGDSLYFEYSSNGGSTWTEYGYNAATKSTLCTTSIGVPIGRTSGATEYTTLSRTRITLTAQNGTTGYVYTDPRKMLINISSSGGMQVLVETRTGTNYQAGGAWTTFGTYSLSGWSGWNDIPLILGTLGGGTTQTGNNWQLRLTFIMTSKNNDYPTTANVNSIRIYGENAWSTPSTMAATNNLYSFDISQNATFPAEIYANNNQKVYHPGNKPTPADIGAATATHKHASIEVKVGQDAGSSKLSVFQDIDGSGYTTKTGLELFRQSGSSQSMLEISKPYGSTSSIDFITNEAGAFKFNKPIKVGDTNVSLAGHAHEANDITDFNSAVLALSPAGARPASSIDTSILGSTTASATKFLAGDRAWKRIAFSVITDKPDTLSGYGITDAAPLSHASSTSNPHSVTAAQINAMSTSHAANAITSTNISNWSSAYGWGNHASAGYIKAHPTITMGTNTTNTSSPGYAGSFTAIDSITKDSNGHVTKINTKTVTMPSAQSIPSIPSVMDTTEGNTGTATTQRTINAKNLKAIILNHSPAGARTPTGHGHSKSDITNFDSEVLALSPAGARTPTAHQHSATDIVGGRFSLDRLPTISIAKGGTGATTALAARANLGLGNGATATNVIRQVSFQNNILTIEVV